ncbi:hypothetical protein [Chelativorans salis]|uniref:Lipoprotein n=1 Tax=Chelativorans salis TaxID=2978478 RepID=A0ABT2LSJ4_9HYPH|nr:hypothetical protein [Chelativorans sp. EGI FJ00035]MCT7376812.1 hypothetical protein [Chelativorans sp. EGI FJ00035]
MKRMIIAMAVTGLTAACATTTTYDVAGLPNKNTANLCRIVAENTDENYRLAAAKLLARRGATAEKCLKLIEVDNAMFATAIGVSGAALAAGVGASNGGGYSPSYGSSGVAWDQFYNQYYQPIWRCRDKSNGEFVPDSYCRRKLMVDSTWPGLST